MSEQVGTVSAPSAGTVDHLHPDAGSEESAHERSEVRRAVVRFVLTGLLTLAVVAVPSALLMQHIVRQHTLEGLETTTTLMADDMIAPLIDAAFLAGDAQAVAVVDQVARGRIAGGSVRRITIWDGTGRVLYSDAGDLVGRRFADHEWTDQLLADWQPVAVVEQHGDGRSDYEFDGGEYVEVYAPFQATTGQPLIFEAYYPVAVVHRQQRELLLRLLPVGLGTLVVFQLAQLPLAARLASRVQNLQRSRARLVRQAAAASDLERRRIARDLHDDVIQGLAGLGYELESLSERADPAQRDDLVRAGRVLRSNVAGLRGMLTEIYPTDLDGLGLPAAVEGLAERLRDRGIEVRTDVADDLPLGRSTATLAYRVVREALGNALKYADPRVVTVQATVHDAQLAVEVADDGSGFDPGVPPRRGHIGLQLIRDSVHELGGTVRVDSAPGAGTRLTATIPLT
jgi:two-component system NarL family sensor kinase